MVMCGPQFALQSLRDFVIDFNFDYIYGMDISSTCSNRGIYEELSILYNPYSKYGRQAFIDEIDSISSREFDGYKGETYQASMESKLNIVSDYSSVGVNLTEDILHFLQNVACVTTANNADRIANNDVNVYYFKDPKYDFVASKQTADSIKKITGMEYESHKLVLNNMFNFDKINNIFKVLLQCCESVYVSMGSSGFEVLTKTIMPIRDKYNLYYFDQESLDAINDVYTRISNENPIKLDTAEKLMTLVQ